MAYDCTTVHYRPNHFDLDICSNGKEQSYQVKGNTSNLDAVIYRNKEVCLSQRGMQPITLLCQVSLEIGKVPKRQQFVRQVTI